MAGLETSKDYGETATAVSLGIAVLRKCKRNSWAELNDAMAADDVTVIKAFQALELTDAQLDVISRRQRELGLVRISPAVIPAVCPVCGHFILTSDTATSRCLVTAGCTGKPVKVAAAKATKAPPRPAAEPTVPAEAEDPMSIDEAVEALAAATEELYEFVAARDAAADEFEAVANAVTAEFESGTPSLDDLGEDFTDEPSEPVATSGRIVLDDDNGFD